MTATTTDETRMYVITYRSTEFDQYANEFPSRMVFVRANTAADALVFATATVFGGSRGSRPETEKERAVWGLGCTRLLSEPECPLCLGRLHRPSKGYCHGCGRSAEQVDGIVKGRT